MARTKMTGKAKEKRYPLATFPENANRDEFETDDDQQSITTTITANDDEQPNKVSNGQQKKKVNIKSYSGI